MSLIGILLTNLGTPSEATTKSVRRYLAEFLADPYVVAIPRWIWLPILYGLVLTIRPRRSAKLYQKIWTEQGSPLLTGCQAVLKKLQMVFDHNTKPTIALGMRYGEPSLLEALLELRQAQVNKILVLPLYPQYSKTTTLSTVAKIKRHLDDLKWQVEIECIQHYAEQNDYISALANQITEFWRTNKRGQKLLFSFHGIPKKLSYQGDPYENLCFATANAVATKLNLSEDVWQVVFQSRFGREEWLKPYCAEVLRKLPDDGYRSIDIICPGFPIDCLETLEEIAITNKEIFIQAGGMEYNYIPSLNDSNEHIEALQKILQTYLTNS